MLNQSSVIQRRSPLFTPYVPQNVSGEWYAPKSATSLDKIPEELGQPMTFSQIYLDIVTF